MFYICTLYVLHMYILLYVHDEKIILNFQKARLFKMNFINFTHYIIITHLNCLQLRICTLSAFV